MKQSAPQAKPDHRAAVMTIEDMPEEFRPLCEIVGMEKAVELARKMGGTPLYVPRLSTITRGVKYRTIRNEFTGSNYKQLANKYGYTVQWIRDIVADRTKRQNRKAKAAKKDA